jgi:hypothetical protein
MVLVPGDGSVWTRSVDGGGWSQAPLAGPVPAARTGSSLVYDSRRHRALMWGGTIAGVGNTLQLWELALEPPLVARPPLRHPPAGNAFAIHVPAVVRGSLGAELSLPDAAAARVDVFDVVGRRLLSTTLAAGAGTRHFEIAGVASLRPGVYLLRATQGAAVTTSRFVKLE